ncbi:endoplasmic reticulum membrane sensor NFE2L1-like isoform X1 [Tachypleus tridentatus]|uniref:endoplasmic reticulum membrane sensor NFE2L1-like isoform X1 n=2 Tax=Tachypleus tridentatus TaxID=6853 RepID=UPI003FD381F1
MTRYKKIVNSELVQLALVVSLLWLNPESYLDLIMDTVSEVHEVFLGQSSAYTQSHFHSVNNRLHGYISPKALDVNNINIVSTLMELNALGRYCRFHEFQNIVITYVANTENLEPQNMEQPISADNPNMFYGENVGNFESESQDRIEIQRNGSINIDSVNSVPEQFNNMSLDTVRNQDAVLSTGSELTAEDMDLIEVLWKQDIDLGISRDVFDGKAALESDKAIIQTELLKKQELKEDKVINDESLPSSYNPWEGISYSIDSETGEHVILNEQPGNESTNQLNFEYESHVLGVEVFQQLTDELNRIPIDEAFRLFDQGVLNQTEPFGCHEITGTYTEELPEDPEDLIHELKQFSELLQKTAENNESNQEPVEIPPSVENCWEELSFPVVSMNTTNPFPMLASDGTQSFYAPSNSNMSGMAVDTLENLNNHYSEVLLQNATLGLPAPDLTDLTSADPVGEMCGVGSSLETSLGTLTNATEPLSEGMIESAYDQIFSEFSYLGNTSMFTVNHDTDQLLTDLFAEEDIKLIEKAATTGAAVFNTPVNIGENKCDANSDSAVSSMGSDCVSSMSDGEWLESCSETSTHQDDKEISVHMELNHSLALSSEINKRDPLTHFSGIQYPPVAQKKYKLFGRQQQNFKNENCGSTFQELDQKEQPFKNFQQLTENGNAGSDTSGPHPHTSTEETPNQEHNDNCSGRSSVNSVRSTYPKSFHHNHTYHLPLNGSDCSQKPIMRDKLKAQLEEQDQRSRDEKNVKAMKLPLSVSEIINLPIDEFNERISKYNLTEPQLSLIKDIRRRGKNKVAAQNCRKRKMDQVVDLEKELNVLQQEKLELDTVHQKMLNFYQLAQDKYTQLYKYIMKESYGQQELPDLASSSSQELGSFSIPTNSTKEGETSTENSKGARAKRKTDKK